MEYKLWTRFSQKNTNPVGLALPFKVWILHNFTIFYNVVNHVVCKCIYENMMAHLYES